MAKQQTPSPEPRTLVPAHDPLVGIVMINPDLTQFKGMPLAEQLAGIWGNKPSNLAGVGLLAGFRRSSRNCLAVAKVTAWNRPSKELLPHHSEQLLKKHGSVATLELIPNHPILGMSIAAIPGQYVYGVTVMKLSEFKQLLGAGRPEKVVWEEETSVAVEEVVYNF